MWDGYLGLDIFDVSFFFFFFFFLILMFKQVLKHVYNNLKTHFFINLKDMYDYYYYYYYYYFILFYYFLFFFFFFFYLFYFFFFFLVGEIITCGKTCK